MSLLSDFEFKKTFDDTMIPVADSAPPIDFWPYADKIPECDFSGHDCSSSEVMHVWRTNDQRYEHVLIKSEYDKNVFMVIVIDLLALEVHGHHLLDLNQKYSTSSLS
ncbi:MAG: hypothetical protein ACSHX0_05485 [Akkermansiaceae bacterium]